MGQSEYISWVKCTSWLSNFVNLRGLRQPDGRPLYEYHATNAEYNQLTQLLCAVVKWSTKTGHRVRVFSSIDFPIRLVVTHHYIRAVLV
ncbi:hypothetical protein, partial [Escherichia coli]|uniref:hypothetical protein n=2 Tax=Escherichia coli TaxID=562 RepID=UPI002AC34A9D